MTSFSARLTCEPYEHTLNVDGLSFPIPIKEIPKFENLNPTIGVNVLSLDDDGGYYVEYLSPTVVDGTTLTCCY